MWHASFESQYLQFACDRPRGSLQVVTLMSHSPDGNITQILVGMLTWLKNNQSINQLIDRSINQSINLSINQSIIQIVTDVSC